jgi:hypothetical protein
MVNSYQCVQVPAVTIYQSTGSNIQQDLTLQEYRFEKLKRRIL